MKLPWACNDRPERSPGVKAQIRQIAAGLFQITLFPPFPGFEDFIGVYLHQGPPAFLVDVGPAVTAPQLLTALDEIGIPCLDYIFLTHIHLDHAGAVGEVAARFPAAQVVCHKLAFNHLVEPGRLVQGTIKTLGDLGRGYGPMKAVPAERLSDADGFNEKSIHAVLTPGHAPHHVSYLFGSILFAGEAGGVSPPFAAAEMYLRPATPPRFFLETTVKSIDALMELSPSSICYGHLGIKEDAVGRLGAHRRQLLDWFAAAVEENRRTVKADLAQVLLRRLAAEDPLLSILPGLPPAVRKREEFFLMNSISGFISALEALTDNP